MSCGAPCSTKVSSTKRIRPCGSRMPVLSLPSENVPAPPSPNCTLEAGSSAPPFQKDSTFSRRRPISSPRSISSGFCPAMASTSAQNSPRRPGPDDHRPPCRSRRRDRDRIDRPLERRDVPAAVLLQDLPLALRRQRAVDRVDIENVRLFARIHRLARNADLRALPVPQVQEPARLALDLFRRMPRAQLHLADPYHPRLSLLSGTLRVTVQNASRSSYLSVSIL